MLWVCSTSCTHPYWWNGWQNTAVLLCTHFHDKVRSVSCYCCWNLSVVMVLCFQSIISFRSRSKYNRPVEHDSYISGLACSLLLSLLPSSVLGYRTAGRCPSTWTEPHQGQSLLPSVLLKSLCPPTSPLPGESVMLQTFCQLSWHCFALLAVSLPHTGPDSDSSLTSLSSSVLDPMLYSASDQDLYCICLVPSL